MTEASQVARGGWRDYPALAFDPVLTAAIEAFNEVGYHGATVRDIARRCGLSVAGIYHHHAGKQEMLLSILRTSMTDLLERNDAARAEAGDDPYARFCNQVESLALSHMYRRAETSLGSTEMRALTPPNRKVIIGMRAELQHRIQEDVDAGIRIGVFATPYSKEAVRGIAVMCIATGQWYSAAGPLSAEDVARHCVALALDTVRAVRGGDEDAVA